MDSVEQRGAQAYLQRRNKKRRMGIFSKKRRKEGNEGRERTLNYGKLSFSRVRLVEKGGGTIAEERLHVSNIQAAGNVLTSLLVSNRPGNLGLTATETNPSSF
jgi:hypothetical protein